MPSDEALLERLRRGDLRAFDELYARHEGHLFGFIRAHLRDAAEAEDVMHETFLAVLRERPQAGSFRAWLFQAARNACLNRLRTVRRAEAALAQVAAQEGPERPLAPALLEQAQSARELAAAVERLPSHLGELYHLRARGLSYAQLAEVLALPLGTVKSRLHELVKRLKQEVS